jgi:hypothetical protein
MMSNEPTTTGSDVPVKVADGGEALRGEDRSSPVLGEVKAEPVLAERQDAPALWTRPVRLAVFAVVSLAGLAYLAFGTVLARNVTYNLNVDEGAYNGIPRFSRESMMSVWSTMLDRAPDFGSTDLIRLVLVGGGAAFLVASIAILYLTLVPSRGEWSADLSGTGSESRPGD